MSWGIVAYGPAIVVYVTLNVLMHTISNDVIVNEIKNIVRSHYRVFCLLEFNIAQTYSMIAEVHT